MEHEETFGTKKYNYVSFIMIYLSNSNVFCIFAVKMITIRLWKKQ